MVVAASSDMVEAPECMEETRRKLSLADEHVICSFYETGLLSCGLPCRSCCRPTTDGPPREERT